MPLFRTIDEAVTTGSTAGIWGSAVKIQRVGVSGRGLGSRQRYVYSLVYRVRSTRQKSGSIYHHLGMTSPASLGKNRPCSMETYTPYVHNDKLWCQLALTEIELNRFLIRNMFNFEMFVLFVFALFVLVRYLLSTFV